MHERNSSGFNDFRQILSTDINIGDFQCKSNDKSYDIFSFKSSDNKDIKTNLKGLITAACSQLNDKTTYGTDDPKSSVDRWIDVLINNKKMKGIIGYHGTAPAAGNSWTPDDEVIKDFLNLSA